jgi:prepilin-type N-terminal cleavage/methylation domain-containing protein
MNVCGDIAAIARNGGRRPAGRGFTLVEVLAAIVVIGILAATVVAVLLGPGAGRQTRQTMAVVLAALDRYCERTGSYPPAAGTDRRARNAALVVALRGCADARARLVNVPGDALRREGATTWLVDEWGQVLAYTPSGGAGGGPYLESAGADGDFATGEDNIRSDGQ